jgi:hypothetical protein
MMAYRTQRHVFLGFAIAILLLGLLLLSIVAGIQFIRPARGAQSTPVPVSIVDTGNVYALETIACNSGVSPCTIGASSTVVLNVAPRRRECLVQNIGIQDFYCLRGAGTASTANMHFILKAASGANKGDGGSYSCNQGPLVWGGSLTCIAASAGGSLTVSAD